IRRIVAECRRIKPASGDALRLELRGAHPTIAIADAAVLDEESVHHALAEKPVMRVAERRKLGVGPGEVERAVEVTRHFPFDHEVVGVAFDEQRREIAGEIGQGGKRLHQYLLGAGLYPALTERLRYSMLTATT